MKFLKTFALFLICNFGALAIGVWFTDNGPQSNWYLQLRKAPWTPPGWVFGTAWSSIMLCFSFYMAYLYTALPNTRVKILFTIQFILNVGWNFIFFNQHFITFGMLIILALTGVVTVFMVDYRQLLKLKTLLILPYVLWLCVANSLNLYILLYN